MCEVFTDCYSVTFDSSTTNEYADMSMKTFDSIITDYMKEQKIPGGALALSFNGRIIHRQGYGWTGTGERCLSTSYFRIASISKTITAMAIMQLVEQRKLQLSDKIFSRKGKGILKNFTPAGPSVKALEGITVRHLLEHSGGWDRETGVDPVYIPPQTVCPLEDQDSVSPVDLFINYHANLIQYMIKQKLDFKPGTRHGYSNFGYLVLGHVIEKITGIPFSHYIHDFINQAGEFLVYEGDELYREHPCEVRYFENCVSIHPSIVPYQGDIWTMQYGGFHMQGTASYGGLVASPVQLLLLLSTLDLEKWKEKRILTEDSISQMLACPKFEKGSEWYGLGLDVEDKGQTWGHTGYMDGTTTTFRRDKSGFSWVLLFNAGATDQDLDGLIRFALSSLQPCMNPVGLKNNPENIKRFEISSKDAAQIYHILIPLRNVEAITSSLKSEGYYMQDIDLVVYENEYFVNMIWNCNVAKFDWFYKIYHDVTTCIGASDSEKDIACYIRNGFSIHMLSTCTDSKHQSDIYTAIIYVRHHNRQSIQHVKFLQDISEESPLDFQSHGNVLICSICYYCEKLYASVVFEEYDTIKNGISLLNNSEQTIHSTLCSTNDLADNLESRASMNVCKFKRIIKSGPIPSPAGVSICSVQLDSVNMVEKSSSITKSDLTEDEFLDELRKQALEHYGLTFIQFYKVPNKRDVFISAIWSKFKVHECYQRLGASRYSFMNELLESSGEVTPLEAIRAYIEDGVLLFAGIWTAGKFKSKRSKRRRASNSSIEVIKTLRKKKPLG